MPPFWISNEELQERFKWKQTHLSCCEVFSRSWYSSFNWQKGGNFKIIFPILYPIIYNPANKNCSYLFTKFAKNTCLWQSQVNHPIAWSLTQTTYVNLTPTTAKTTSAEEWIHKSRKLTENKNTHMNNRVLILKVIFITLFCSQPQAEPQQKAFLYYDSGKTSIIYL